MIRVLLALAFLGFAGIANAQGLATGSNAVGASTLLTVPAKDEVTLTVGREDARLVLQLLDALSCGTVAQMSVCIKAMELKGRIQKQIIQLESK